MKFITIREIADNETTISSTRWGWAYALKIDAIVIVAVILAGIAAHFIPCIPDFDTSFYGSVALLLGVRTTITGTTKALQGFEPHAKFDKEVQPKNKEESEEEPVEEK